MSLCVVCAQPTPGHDDVCAFHVFSHGCDFLHRGVLRPAARERGDALEVLVGALEEETVSA